VRYAGLTAVPRLNSLQSAAGLAVAKLTGSIFTIATLVVVVMPSLAESLVQVNYGWRTDGEYSCSAFDLAHEPWRRWACIDPISNLEDWTSKTDMELSSNPLCHGVTLVRFPWGPGDLNQKAELLKQSHWYFFITFYTTGKESQPWTLVSPDNKHSFKGKGDPHEIAQKVCAVIQGAGGAWAQ
jgi:hypothetical protein